MRKAFLWALLWAGACSVCSGAKSSRPRNYETHDYYALHLDSSTSPQEIADYLNLEHDGQVGDLPDHHIFKAPKHAEDIVQDAIQDLKRRRRRKRDLEPHVLDSIKYDQKQVLRKRLVKRSVIPHLEERARSGVEAKEERAAVAKELSIADPIFDEQWHIYNTQEVGNDLNVTGVWLQGITGHNATVCIIDDGLDMDSLDLKPNYFAAGSYDFNDQVKEPKPRLSDDLHGTRCAGEVAAARNNVCGIGVAYDAKVSGVRILSKPISDIDEAESVIYGYQDNDIYSCSWGPPDDGQTMEAPGILIRRAMVKAVQAGRAGKGTIYVFAAGNGALNDDNCNFDGYTNSIYSITVGAVDRMDRHPYYSEKCSAQLVVTYSSGNTDAIHTTDVGVNKCTKTHGGTSAAGPLAAGVYALVLSIRPDLTWRDMQWLNVMTAVPIYVDGTEWQTTALGKNYSHQYGYGKLDAYAIVEAAKTWKNVKPQAWYFAPWIHVKAPVPQGDKGLASIFEITEQMLTDANLERIEHVTVTMNVEHTRRGDLSVELRSPSGVVSHLSTSRKTDEAHVGYVDWTFMSVVHWGDSGVGKWTVVVKDTIENEHTGTFIDWKLKLFGEARDEKVAKLLPLPGEHDDDADDSFLPSPFPTFGLSKRTQVWMYGALALILAFCAGVGTYLYVQRRKRLRNAGREGYEFEMLDEQDDEEVALVEGKRSGGAAKPSRQRRAGELYDAFAGESDEEELFFSDGEGSEDRRYRDEDEGEESDANEKAGSPR
ncbi:hypothetical protein EJ06DRAFT_301304 [Trichodelitschia bisporula]|uniref:P/Homo B domain-containing protein n=1 Tax=Trichodelitschia bisporula TaxID=703511 RepID=A0A6G1I7K9_9PEZI|nr:hypothetical protein EJ06DRAFT_301304 [Trichodelitschia bisporula]